MEGPIALAGFEPISLESSSAPNKFYTHHNLENADQSLLLIRLPHGMNAASLNGATIDLSSSGSTNIIGALEYKSDSYTIAKLPGELQPTVTLFHPTTKAMAQFETVKIKESWAVTLQLEPSQPSRNNPLVSGENSGSRNIISPSKAVGSQKKAQPHGLKKRFMPIGAFGDLGIDTKMNGESPTKKSKKIRSLAETVEKHNEVKAEGSCSSPKKSKSKKKSMHLATKLEK